MSVLHQDVTGKEGQHRRLKQAASPHPNLSLCSSQSSRYSKGSLSVGENSVQGKTQMKHQQGLSPSEQALLRAVSVHGVTHGQGLDLSKHIGNKHTAANLAPRQEILFSSCFFRPVKKYTLQYPFRVK